MAQLLLELFSEEIPARMQAQASRDLLRLSADRLKAAGLPIDQMQSFAGPRRLTLVVEGLPIVQPDRLDEIKGPRANAPPQALEGFLRKTGLAFEDLHERDGAFYARIAQQGRATNAVVADLVRDVLPGFPWPKSMRWGSGGFRWVRPLKRILCLFDGAVVELDVAGIAAGRVTEGHRFMGDNHQPIAVVDFGQYRQALWDHFVSIDAEDRSRVILTGARAACAEAGLELVEDPGLLEEVSGLVEWPVPLLGPMDPAFLDLPPEVIRTSMRTHQKYFAVRRPGESRALAPHFVVVANIAARDGGAALVAGNAKVLAARLNDARFFWAEDQKVRLADRLDKLKGVTFHAELGTLFDRVLRIEALARDIAPRVGADPALSAQAARLCKADLVTGMVGEFPELQGVMGGYYARAEGYDAQIADAVRDHYKPIGPSDSAPTAPVTAALALADKLDTLLGFFAIDEKPTGSKDPYALRRAALGVIRIILEGKLRLSIGDVLGRPLARLAETRPVNRLSSVETGQAQTPQVASDLLRFLADRLEVVLRDQGKRFDLVAAVLANQDDDLVRVVARLEALSNFLATDDGANLLAGYKRAVNILKAEGKKGEDLDLDVNPELSDHGPMEEAALAAALRTETGRVDEALSQEDFTGALRRLAHLRSPVDAFFDKVLVNDADPHVRLNRLRLLTQVRDTANRVADFSLISG